MSFDHRQFVIATVLRALGSNTYSPAAVRLLAGTAAVESAFGTYLKQKKDGPALGVLQMEPATEEDIWANYLAYRERLSTVIWGLCGLDRPDAMHLQLNLIYQICMARVHYLRVKAPIPDTIDPAALGAYWKAHYNTEAGRGHVAHFIAAWERYVLPYPEVDEEAY